MKKLLITATFLITMFSFISVKAVSNDMVNTLLKGNSINETQETTTVEDKLKFTINNITGFSVSLAIFFKELKKKY